MRQSTKGWLKAAVITFGVVDCVGIYIAQHRLSQPVPAATGNDLAYAMPAETGVFRPDQGMPALDRRAISAPTAKAAPAPKAAPTVETAPALPAAPRLAMTAPAPVAEAAPATPHFAMAAPAIAPLHRDAAPHATANGARPRVARSAPTTMSALVPARNQTRLFADAFSGMGMANVPLDAPITVQLDDGSARAALADDGAADMRLAHNNAPAHDAGSAAGSAANSAAALPEAGPAAILPDSDVL